MSSETAHRLVDVHSHFVTPWYIEEAIAAGHRSPDGMPQWPTWSVDDHLRLMDDNGIDRSVLSISSPGVYFGDADASADLSRRVNDYAAQVCNAHPDRFGFFASVPLPDVDGAIYEAARALEELGAAGVVTETNIHGRYLSDPAFEPFFAELSRREEVLFVHPTSPPGSQETALGFPRPMLEFLIDTTRSIAALILNGTLTRNDGIEMIVSHCGAFLPVVADRLALFAQGFLAGQQGTVEIDAVLRRLWFDVAGTPVPTQAETLIGKVGAERLLYGSDYCWTPAPLVANQVASLDAQWRQDLRGPWRELLAENATRLWTANS